MRRSSAVVVTALLALGGAAAACQSTESGRPILTGSGFQVEAVTRDGRQIRGFLKADNIPLSGLNAAGRPVSATVEKPPDWSSSDLGCEVDWISDRGIFLVRTLAWTGELKRLEMRLEVLGDSGIMVLDGGEIVRLRLRYVKN